MAASIPKTDPERGVQSVCYVVSRFPALSQTFVANEMTAVEQAGVRVELASIWSVDSGHHEGHTGHAVEKPFLDRVMSMNLKSLKDWVQVCRAILMKPSIVLTILAMMPEHAKSPNLFAKLIGAVPPGLWLGAELRKSPVDHIHAHFITSPTTVALLASKVSGIPYSATAHAFDITSTDPRWVNGSVERKCTEAANIVTISEYNVNDMLGRWPALESIQLDLVYNGIDVSMFDPQRSRPALELEPTETLRVLSVSNLAEKKGHHVLIEAVDLLKKSGTNVSLEIYGEGPEQNRLDELIDRLGCHEYVKLMGRAGQAQVKQLMQEADIFAVACVMMSSGDADGLPTVLLESLAMELPTVSTHMTGVPEIVIEGETGRCVEPDNPQALADAMQWMKENPSEARLQAKRGRALVHSRFNRQNSAPALIETWERAHTAMERTV